MKFKLVYDIASLPTGLDPGNLTKIFEQHHIVYWDSSKGVKPKLYDGGDLAEGDELLVIDTAGKEVDFTTWSQEFHDEDYWGKELHKCKQSPTYFYANYATTEWPVTSEGTRKYLHSIGLKDLVAKDSEDASKLWEAQKEVMKEATKHVTRELLEDRRAALDIMKAEYDTKVGELEESLSGKVALKDGNTGQHLPERKRISNLAEKIKKVLPVHPKYSEKYRNRKGKWDSPMLFNTSYHILLQMYHDVLQNNSGK